MVKEIMEEIKKAESSAEQSLEDARYRAKYMIDQQKQQCEDLMAKALEEQKLSAEKEMQAAIDKGKKYEADAWDETTKEKQDIIKLVNQKEKEAIDLVIGELLQ